MAFSIVLALLAFPFIHQDDCSERFMCHKCDMLILICIYIHTYTILLSISLMTREYSIQVVALYIINLQKSIPSVIHRLRRCLSEGGSLTVDYTKKKLSQRNLYILQ